MTLGHLHRSHKPSRSSRPNVASILALLPMPANPLTTTRVRTTMPSDGTTQMVPRESVSFQLSACRCNLEIGGGINLHLQVILRSGAISFQL